MILLSYADFFSKFTFWNTIRVTNSVDPDQDRHSVGPDLVPNCLQRLSADDISQSPPASKGLKQNFASFTRNVMSSVGKLHIV